MSQSCPEPKHSLIPLSRLPELSTSRQNSAMQLLSQGDTHYQSYLIRGLKRDLGLATLNYRQALEMNPTLAEGHVKLAMALWTQGDLSLELALDYCDTALSLEPGYSEAYFHKAQFLARSGRMDAAIYNYRQALKMGVESPVQARFALSKALLAQANLLPIEQVSHRFGLTLESILNWLQGFCQLPTDRGTSWLMLKAAYLDIQILSMLSIGKALKGLNLKDMAEKVYRFSTLRLPEEPIFQHLLGDLYADQKNMDGALYAYTRAHELDLDNPLILKKLGQVYQACNDSANAVRALEKAVSVNAKDFETVYTLAHAYTDQHQYMRALYYYRALLDESPENAFLHSHMAYVLFKLNDYDGAIHEYQTAIELGSDPVWRATIAQTLGTIYYQVKQDCDAAAETFQLSMRFNPNDLECLSLLGDVYTEQGKFEAAIQAYRTILAQEPDNADCYNYLGYLLWQLDKNDEAIDAYNRSLALQPVNPIAYNNLGVIYLDEKCQPQAAMMLFQKAFQQDPDYTLACFNVARVYEALGQTSQAAKGYAQAMALNQQNQALEPAEIEERLAHLFQV